MVPATGIAAAPSPAGGPVRRPTRIPFPVDQIGKALDSARRHPDPDLPGLPAAARQGRSRRRAFQGAGRRGHRGVQPAARDVRRPSVRRPACATGLGRGHAVDAALDRIAAGPRARRAGHGGRVPTNFSSESSAPSAASARPSVWGRCASSSRPGARCWSQAPRSSAPRSNTSRSWSQAWNKGTQRPVAGIAGDGRARRARRVAARLHTPVG